MAFAYAGGGLGKGGKATLFVEGQKVGEGEIGATLAFVFSADDGCDVGEDSGAAVSPDYGTVGNAFKGEVRGVQLSIADDPNNADHLVKPKDAISRVGTAVNRHPLANHAGCSEERPADSRAKQTKPKRKPQRKQK